jgi:Fur family ferric uptake transcriptional regulator
MPQTRQRQAILAVLREAGRPLTRDEILAAGRQRLPRLGSATVDRAIRNMAGSFQLVGVHFPGQPRRYELPTESEHPHFICRVCDRVYDLPVAMRVPSIDSPPGFHISGGEVIYSGTCPRCKDAARRRRT